MKTLPSLISMSLIVAFGAACSSSGGHRNNPVDNAALPSTVQVPDGHHQKLWSRGVGEITYACREKADQKGSYGWVFVAPVATLYGSDKAVLGKYYAGPTWEGMDGSKVTGKQAGVAPMGAENIPLQLVKASPAGSGGIFGDVAYIQRLKTKGGIAPASTCNAASAGMEQKVAYEADYVYYVAR
jgi:hypothetical protein